MRKHLDEPLVSGYMKNFSTNEGGNLSYFSENPYLQPLLPTILKKLHNPSNRLQRSKLTSGTNISILNHYV